MIIADTSGLLAAMDPDEVHHEACRVVIDEEKAPLVVSPFVLAELDYLISRKLGTDAELALLEDIASGAYQLATLGSADVAAARTLVEQYRDLDIGLADASLVVLAAKHRTLDLLTLDYRHFRAMRNSKGEAFRLMPADG